MQTAALVALAVSLAGMSASAQTTQVPRGTSNAPQAEGRQLPLRVVALVAAHLEGGGLRNEPVAGVE